MNVSDIFSEFTPPQISDTEAAQVLDKYYGVQGEFILLRGERDQNVRVQTDCGRQLVLKISGQAESIDAIDFQAQLFDHLQKVAPDPSIPNNIRTKDGALYCDHVFDNGVQHAMRLVTYVAGDPLETKGSVGRNTLIDVGRFQGYICRSLAGFFHPAARRPMPWDMCNGLAFSDELLGFLDPEVTASIAPHLDRLQTETLPALQALRAQVIHNDVHPGNILTGTGGKISGLIDFGDAIFAPLLQELAVSVASMIERHPDNPGAILSALESGFDDTFPLWPEEKELLLDAAILRGLLSVGLGTCKYALLPASQRQKDVLDASRSGLLASLSLHVNKLHTGAVPEAAERLLGRRQRVMSPTYKLHYKKPIHVVRGKGVYLYDGEGRKYLDCYNNVPSVGHCNPYVLDALNQQVGTLNTHTRYLHDEVVRYAERISATLPDEIDTCMFVCTGSEANDLAYRIARTVTGKRGVLVSEGAYHGNTIALAELSLNAADRANYPSHVAPIPLPDTYRGQISPDEANIGEKFAALADGAIEEMAQSPHGLAMVMIDAIFDNPGIFCAPPDYLRNLFKRVRGAGGLVVVDEVQSGLCRLGENFWGFQDSGVVPDIVTMGKPMGNGFPIAVVAAKRDIMDEFAARAAYFNTFAGSPVAAAVGNAVLDIVEQENILTSVNSTGDRLISGLRRLSESYDCIGDIRGKGLFLGVDLIENDNTRAPASKTAHALVNGLRNRGFLLAVNGAFDNVIKIRPPLVFSSENADQLLEAMNAELASMVGT